MSCRTTNVKEKHNQGLSSSPLWHKLTRPGTQRYLYVRMCKRVHIFPLAQSFIVIRDSS